MGAARRTEGGHPGEFGPESYRHWRATDLGGITEELERRLIMQLAGPLHDRAVLDVGCGDGALIGAFCDAGASLPVGCDGDRRMIERAAANAAMRPAAIAYALARAEQLPFRDASFDLVTAITVLAFVPDPEKALREMARVLRPGGRIVIGDLGKWSQWAAARRLRGWLGEGVWRAATFRSAAEWRCLAERAGLRVVNVAGAIYYPRCTSLARLMAPLDAMLGRLTTFGAAFVAVTAEKKP